MANTDITLAGGMRANLVNLQLIAMLQGRTTERLASGKRVNSAIDDPSAYFAAQNHVSRANDLTARKTEIGEAIQLIKAATEGIDGIVSLIQQMKGLAASAKSANAADRATLATQFGALRTQLDQLAVDSSYKGTNLLQSGTLTVSFNEDGSSSITLTGFDADTSGLPIAAAANTWQLDANIDAATTELDAALTSLRTQAATLSSNNGVMTTRQAFITNMVNTLSEGASNLTAADSNEEGANMLALQTRQQLGMVALQLSSQAQQSILRLFG